MNEKIHYMKLWNDSFLSVKEGSKTIEMRLNDEKRSKININDYIVFVNTKTSEELKVKVTNLYKYSDFKELYNHHSKTVIGYKEKENASYTDMFEYYSEEDILRYGVVGIEIKII